MTNNFFWNNAKNKAHKLGLKKQKIRNNENVSFGKIGINYYFVVFFVFVPLAVFEKKIKIRREPIICAAKIMENITSQSLNLHFKILLFL